jgi:hypothetical protein
MKALKLWPAAAAALMLLLVGWGTGLYEVPRYEQACELCAGTGARAQTLWFLRPGLGVPFLASDGGMLIRYKQAGHPLFERIGLVLESRTRIQERAFLRLPYLPLLYRLSAEGRSPVK